MLPPSIKSRPVYGKLAPQKGRHHIFVADVDGAGAIVDMARDCPPDFFAQSTIVHVGRAEQSRSLDVLRHLGSKSLIECPTIGAALPRLVQMFATARMGTRLYIAGMEGLIGQVMRVAIEAGIEPRAVTTEHRGSMARRVQCVHCKGITEDVTATPFRCSHCGLHLFVRDHYSRRIAAFQGVCVDAEEPGVVPEVEELYP